MVSHKLVTLSALVLILAVIATNAGKKSNGNKGVGSEKEMEMGIIALCVSCPAAQKPVADFKKCLSSNGATQVVKAATGNNPEKCAQAVMSEAETMYKNVDMTKIESCLQELKPVWTALTQCYQKLEGKAGGK